MTTQEAIEILNDGEWWENLSDCYRQSNKEFDLLYDATDLAVEALRAQRKVARNAPLTLDELREMDGDKIYIKFIGVSRGFYDDEYAPYYGQHEQYIQKYNGMLRACDLPLKYYGESWLGYRRKP